MQVAATIAVFCGAAFAMCGATAGAAPAAHESHPPGWTDIAPPESSCSDGTPWRFWYRAGVSDKLAVWFEGGDACWTAAQCDRVLRTRSAAKSAPAPPAPNGIFDATRADNPLRGFSIAVLPSCTGDAHVGRHTAQYSRADRTQFAFAHQGADNTRSALDYLQRALQATATPDTESSSPGSYTAAGPTTVFVGGDGTGAIGAAFWAAEIGDRFPTAELIVLGDSAGGYRSLGANTALHAWGALGALPPLPAFADPDRVFFESFYIATAQRHPAARLAQVNFADDAVQRRFMSLLGTPVAELTKPLTCNLNEVRIDAPGFHSFIYPGTRHTLLRTDAMYSTRCHGQSLVGWIDDLIAGRPIENQWCEDATTAAGPTQPNKSPPL